MIHRYHYRDTTWIDLVKPTEDEVGQISQEFGIHPDVANELITPSFKSRVELFPEHIYLILYFPAFKHSHKKEEIRQEVDFIVGKRFLLTARYDTVDAIEQYARVVEVNAILDRGFDGHYAGSIFFGILREMYRSLENELEYMGDWVSNIEKAIFSGKEREMVVALSDVSRILLNFKKSTDFHKEVLDSLDDVGKKIFDEHFSFRLHRLLDEYHKTRHAIHSAIESVGELRETNNSLLSAKQNEVMKILTVVAFIGLPLSLIVSLLQIDTIARPIIGAPNDFWILLSVLGAIGVLMFAFFKYKKWL